MLLENCSTCRWWVLRHKAGERIIDRYTPPLPSDEYWPPKRTHDVGDCRLKAPGILVHPAVDMNAPLEFRKPESVSTVWPQTKPGDYCGEWTPNMPVEARGEI